MKRTQILDARRNIRKEFVAYVSIVIIGMLASLSYLVITYSAETLKKDSLNFFNGLGLWDLEIASTMLMDEGDLEAIRALPGVSEAEPVWQIDGKLRGENGETTVTLISLPGHISRPKLTEGRLPEKAGECAVEQELMNLCHLSIGQSVSPATKAISGVEPLLEKSFVITGVFQTPDHITYVVPITPYIIVTEDSFNKDGLEGAFMKARVRVEGTPEDRYGDDYWAAITPVEEAIQAIADERAALRADKMREGVDERISEGRAKLDEARQQLEDGRRQLEEGRAEFESKRAEFEEGREKLADGRRQYEEGLAEFESKRAEFEDGRAQLEDGRRQLEDGRAQLAEARAKLDEGWKAVREAEPQLRDAKEQLDRGGAVLADAEYQLSAVPALYASALSALIKVERTTGPFLPDAVRGAVQAYEDGMNAYSQGRMLWYYKGEEYLDALALYEKTVKQLEQGEEEYEKGKAALAENEQKLLDGEAQLKDAEQALKDGERQLRDAQAELLDGEAQLREAEQALKDGESQLRDAEAELLDGEAQLLEAEQALLDGESQLRDAEAQIADGERQIRDGEKELRDAEALRNGTVQGQWVVLNNKGNPGYITARENSWKLLSLSMSFSSIFLIVGAMVIYATIGRMVEQHRTLIGATKAMGFYNREVFEKYLFFACTAVMLGVGAGTLIAWGPLQRTVLSFYEELLRYGEGTRSFLPLETGFVVAGAFAISVLAVYLGCAQLLRLPAIQLMQGTVPTGTRKKSGRSAQKNLYYRLIFRNMRTDWGRVLATVISVAGGCVLMVIGFTLRYGISGVPDKQFGGILTYEAEVFFDSGMNENAPAEIEAVLEENGLPYIGLRKADGVFEADNTLNALTLITTEKNTLEGYFALRSLDGDRIDVPDSGVLVPRRFWEHYAFDVGDSVPAYDSGMNRSDLAIAGVFENYYGQLFFLSPQGYEEIFGTAPQTNCYFVKTGGMTINTLREKLAGVEGVQKVNDAWAERHMIEQFTAALNYVVWLMLFIAGMMACFIVANFTMTYIQRKTRELTIMRINGFSVRECTRYVAVDLVVTTVLGIALGLVLGKYLGHAILMTTETPYIQMIREDAVQPFLFSALITGGFSLLTNSFALQKIKKLKLSDII